MGSWPKGIAAPLIRLWCPFRDRQENNKGIQIDWATLCPAGKVRLPLISATKDARDLSGSTIDVIHGVSLRCLAESPSREVTQMLPVDDKVRVRFFLVRPAVPASEFRYAPYSEQYALQHEAFIASDLSTCLDRWQWSD